jgi:hypothetical protein
MRESGRGGYTRTAEVDGRATGPRVATGRLKKTAKAVSSIIFCHCSPDIGSAGRITLRAKRATFSAI